MKKCNKCNIEKPLSEFYKDKSTKDGLSYNCKECKNSYRKENKDKIKEYQEQYYKENRKKLIEYSKKRNKEYYQNNKDKIKEYGNNYIKQRYSTDIEFRLRHNLRSRINHAICNYNFEKKDTSIKELGCSIQDYFLYLESMFDENMNWDNYGTCWEIDHIHPISKGGSFHYTNTQPLTIEENRSKGNRL